MQWWCVARGEPWNWAWQAYPGVWLFVATFASIYWLLARSQSGTTLDSRSAGMTAEASRDMSSLPRSGNPVSFSMRHARARKACAIAGIILLWLTLDWPTGALGAGYLASVHSLQFVMLAMVIPVLLLFGVTGEALARLERAPRALALVRRLTHPPFAAIFFTLVMVATHSPPLLDPLMKSQLGNFVLDMLWLMSGILLAWPILCGVPARPGFTPPLQILYVFGGTIAHVFIGMWLLSAEFPVYATYELAPRVSPLSALYDQHMAGAVIILIGSSLVLTAITVIFFRWQGTGKMLDEPRPTLQ